MLTIEVNDASLTVTEDYFHRILLLITTRKCGIVLHLAASMPVSCSDCNFLKPWLRNFIFVMQALSRSSSYTKVIGQGKGHTSVN